jgi:hypothetical protein
MSSVIASASPRTATPNAPHLPERQAGVGLAVVEAEGFGDQSVWNGRSALGNGDEVTQCLAGAVAVIS